MSRIQKPQPTNKDIVSFLKTTISDATFIQMLKIKYRPFICPFDELLGYIDKKQAVYDIGCGSGQFAALVAEFTDSTNIAGIEIDPKLVENAVKINSRFKDSKSMSFTVFDGSTIPNDIKKYDLIYMIDVYHHIPVEIREEFIKQLYSKMKKGARLMFKDIDGGSPLVPFNKIHDLTFAQELGHEISFKKATAFLSSTGFKIIESRKKRIFVYPHFFILAEK